MAAGVKLRDQVCEALNGLTEHVEAIGSASVLALLAKPIIDLAVGVDERHVIAPVTARLKAEGWIYRGDARTEGGHVFVLETRPRHRVAHLHVVKHDGSQWQNYLRFRDLLRSNRDARERYEEVKLLLVQQDSGDRSAYANGKTQVVASLLCKIR